jgi:hypothetical protein
MWQKVDICVNGDLSRPYLICGRQEPESCRWILKKPGVEDANLCKHASLLRPHVPFEELPAAVPDETEAHGILKGAERLDALKKEPEKWLAAYEKEWGGIKPRVTEHRGPLPPNASIIPASLVDTIKDDGVYKNRWVVCASTAHDKRECETHAPTLSHEGLLLVVFMACQQGVPVCIADVTQAFLQLGKFSEEELAKTPIFIIPPKNPFSTLSSTLWKTDCLYQLKAPVYGFKDVPLRYYLLSDESIRNAGKDCDLCTHPHEPCLYMAPRPGIKPGSPT